MLLLSQWYAELHLPHAARYHASMALYTIVRVDNDGLGEMSVRSGFLLADTFFLAGEMLSYLACVGLVLPMHSSYRVDPDDAELHDDFARAIAQGAVILATAQSSRPRSSSAPELSSMAGTWMTLTRGPWKRRPSRRHGSACRMMRSFPS